MGTTRTLAGPIIFTAFFCLLAAAPPSRADQIVLQNGRTASGDIIAQDDQTVTIDLSDANDSIIRKIQRSHIQRIDTWGHPSSQGPEFIVLPVQGSIGTDITADALKAGIASAKRLFPRYLILDVDSDGGSIVELEKMVDAVHAVPQDIQVVAFVHKAYSAAAVLAMACPKIYVAPGAVIGAAVPLMAMEGALPQDIDAKLKSAIEAKWRTWATAAGHDDLLLRGMVEMDLAIYLIDDGDGHPQLRTSPPGQLLKAPDQILTMTAAEAQSTGLARPAPDYATVARELAGVRCTEASQRPWAAVIRVARHDRHEKTVKLAEAKIAPEVNAIVARENELIAKINADKDGIERLEAQQSPDAANSIEMLRTDAQSAIDELKQLHDRYLSLVNTLPQYND